MSRTLLSVAFLLSTAVSASAHFVFVVPDSHGSTAQVFLSETLSPDNIIPPEILHNAKLSLSDGTAGDEPLLLTKSEHALTTPLPGAGTRIIHGIVDLGINPEGGGKPNRLVYYPKTITGNAFDPRTALHDKTPVEILPEGKPGAVTLELLVNGKPKADAQITVILPDGSQTRVKTNADGKTTPFTQTGRYGAWARDWESVAGEIDGKKFDETHNYATLVFNAGESTAAATAPAPRLAITATPFAKMPQAAASFGAVAADGWLYIYGGHIAKTHSYSTAAVSGQFHRLNLNDGQTWETLPGGPPLQGLNLVAYKGEIYRIGGMQPHNQPGEPDDVRSTDQCARYNPATGKWTDLPALPEPRSSHDIVIIGDKLLVVGGWTLRGQDGEQWLDTMLELDLSSPNSTWKTLPQPFRRRALIAAAYQGKMYAIGGFDENQDTVRQVEIFDPGAASWQHGPDLPGDEQNAFGPAACILDNHLYVSVADGTLYQLDASGAHWDATGRNTPRIVHRLAPIPNALLVIGGAANGNNSDLIEKVVPQQLITNATTPQ